MKTSPLIIIAAIFAASFSGRAITLAGAAAEDAGAPQPTANQSPAGTGEAQTAMATPAATTAQEPDTNDASAPMAGDSCPAPVDYAAMSSGDQSAFLTALRARADTLDRQEEDLADRARVLDAIERRITEKTAEMKALKSELETRLSFAEDAAQNDIAMLAKMYESMKPAKAGEIFNAMEPSFAAGFLTEMTSESAAQILTNMETDKAYAASIIIAGRNASINAP